MTDRLKFLVFGRLLYFRFGVQFIHSFSLPLVVYPNGAQPGTQIQDGVSQAQAHPI